MIKLDSGNLLLKPSYRRQLMGWLRRAAELGGRLGNFVLTITAKRVGRQYEVRANVTSVGGRFACRSRRTDWRTAFRELVRALTVRLHDQYLRRVAVA